MQFIFNCLKATNTLIHKFKAFYHYLIQHHILTICNYSSTSFYRIPIHKTHEKIFISRWIYRAYVYLNGDIQIVWIKSMTWLTPDIWLLFWFPMWSHNNWSSIVPDLPEIMLSRPSLFQPSKGQKQSQREDWSKLWSQDLNEMQP